MIITVVLPKTQVARVLSPNSTANWYAKHRVSKELQQQAGVALRQALDEAGVETLTPPIHVSCHRYYSGNQRPMDMDNLPPTFKPFIDGMKRVLEFDDSPDKMKMRFYQERVKLDFRLEFVLEEVGK